MGVIVESRSVGGITNSVSHILWIGRRLTCSARLICRNLALFGLKVAHDWPGWRHLGDGARVPTIVISPYAKQATWITGSTTRCRS
jgi:hypothetical protein